MRRTLMLILFAGLLLSAAAWFGQRFVRHARAAAQAPPTLPAHIDVDPELRDLAESTLALIERRPRQGMPRFVLGKLYHANDLPGLAVPAYRQAIMLGTDAHELLAMALERTGDVEGAVTEMSVVLARSRAGAESFRRQAQWLSELGRNDEAIDVILRGRRVHPRDRSLAFTHAVLVLDRREPERAMDIIDAADLLRGPEAAATRLLLARAMQQLDRPKEAEAMRRTATMQPPSWPDAAAASLMEARVGAQRLQLTISRLVREGRFAQALPLLEELYDRDPADPRSVNLLAIAHLRLGRADQAVELFREAVRRHPDHFGSHMNLASALRESADAERLAEAWHHAQVAQRLRPASAEVHELAGAILLQRGERERALAAYEEAVRLDARDPLRLLRTALVRNEIGQWAGALELFGRAEALLGEQTPAAQRAALHLGAARAAIEVGRMDDASRHLERAETLVGAEDGRLQALRALMRSRSGHS